jgi:hypothetical protein
MHIVRQLQLELDQVIFEIDSSIVTAVVLTRATSISYLKHLLEGVINLLKLPDWSASVQHCFHEVNLYADTLAKQDRDAPFFFFSYCNILDVLLLLDYMGYFVPHLIS